MGFFSNPFKSVSKAFNSVAGGLGSLGGLLVGGNKSARRASSAVQDLSPSSRRVQEAAAGDVKKRKNRGGFFSNILASDQGRTLGSIGQLFFGR